MMQVDFETFELTRAHLALLRRMNVDWLGCEYGAPAIDCKRPYGNGDVETDILEILCVPRDMQNRDGDWVWSKANHEMAARLHRQTKTALQIVLSSGSFEPGVYATVKYRNEWTRAT